MSLIEGIGDEVTHFFVAIFVIVVVYFAWWSTYTERRDYRTVYLLDRRRRTTRSLIRARVTRRLSNHTEAVTISEGTSTTNTISTPIAEQSETSDVSSNLCHPAPQPRSTEVPSTSETMDADTQNTVRLRRLARFENATTSSNNVSGNDQAHSSTSPTSDGVGNKDNNEDKSKVILNASTSNALSENIIQTDPSKITIKLKYINDDVRIVNGRLEECLGDFKTRHFQTELDSNKIIRLIFNGQVLKQDRQTLQNCGLFDNCVVHCLIHQKRPSVGEGQQHQDGTIQNSEFFRDHRYTGVTNNNNQVIDWDLGNFLFALISFILLAAWYFRYVYAHLYTVTATVGLLIITGIFSIVLIGTYFPDNDQIFNHNIRIRPPRTETTQ
ncbi:hypothetical protein GWI33_019820 [Rhynchophorus ferrugineus]|uniref:Ubiquitin-like domain-containing protein n=1 Tax=Rhynchophorus ferrugineus TaxID=354439 RepID=A0A834M038_RHYFE|nr:hypothetical protein GWI33_019820 [Rhynchophorus ferrugineus]